MGLKNWFLRNERKQLEYERVAVAALREQLQEDQREMREDFLRAIASITEHFALGQRAQAEQVGKLADATAAQSEAFKSHLALFSVSEPPTSRTIRDIDEYQSELQRSGFPTNGTEEEQLTWVLANT